MPGSDIAMPAGASAAGRPLKGGKEGRLREGRTGRSKQIPHQRASTPPDLLTHMPAAAAVAAAARERAGGQQRRRRVHAPGSRPA